VAAWGYSPRQERDRRFGLNCVWLSFLLGVVADYTYAALGVGAKALESNSQLDRYLPPVRVDPTTAEVRPGARPHDADHSRSTMDTLNSVNAGTPTSDVSSPRGRPSSFSNSASALHSIMEQGGLVELRSPSDNNSTSSVPTRTIGDPSTGTALPPKTPPESAAPFRFGSVPPARPAFVEESSSTTIVATRAARPTSIELPRPTLTTGSLSPVPSVGLAGPQDAGLYADSRPAMPAAPPISPVSSHASEVFETGMPVLVVDDDHLTRQLMKRMLTRLGCQVSTAENGEIALELLMGSQRPTPSSEYSPSSVRAHPPEHPWDKDGMYAIVFLDNQMPVLSGLDAVARLRSAGRRDFVVGVTGNALLSDQDEYLEAGVDQ
jgi:osomolarity two-component system, sensor histidine kinase SLN1